jgi:hypothetical protein
MRTIYCIGTLHGGLTNTAELNKILESLHPTQPLVEIVDEDIKKEKLKEYPPEMVSSYRWAKEKEIIVGGFDVHMSVLREGLTDEDNQRAIDQADQLLGELTWIDMNKKENEHVLDPTDWLLDEEKMKKRAVMMLGNIKRIMSPQGVIVIISGCAHLPFWEKHLQGAKFPLRN